MHVNDVFLFFKNHFWYQHIKTIQTIQTILNFSKKKKKNFKFFGNTAAAAFPNVPYFAQRATHHTRHETKKHNQLTKTKKTRTQMNLMYNFFYFNFKPFFYYAILKPYHAGILELHVWYDFFLNFQYWIFNELFIYLFLSFII